MDNRKPGRAPDFTTAALTMLGVNMMWIFFVIWVLYGFVPVLVIAALVYHLILRLEARQRPAGRTTGGKGGHAA